MLTIYAPADDSPRRLSRRRIECGPHTLQILQCAGRGLGSTVWNAGLVFAQIVLGDSSGATCPFRFPPGFWCGKRVLELGCGTGVVSVALKKAGAAEVLATDYSPDLLELAALNAAENGVSVRTAELDWRSPERACTGGPFDVLVAADVIYAESAFEPLIDTVLFLSRPGGVAGGADLFMVHETHNAGTHLFFDMADRRGLSVDVLGERTYSRDAKDANDFCFDATWTEEQGGGDFSVKVMRIRARREESAAAPGS